MADGLALLEQPAASEQPIPKLSQKRRPQLSPSEKEKIRELAARGQTANEIARKLVDRPPRQVRDAMRAMGLAKPIPPAPAASTSSPRAPTKPKQSKPHQPFTAGDRVRIANLVATGLSAAQIAERIHRGLPQVSRIVREITSSSTKPTETSLQLNVPARTMTALEAAARRRHLKPATLAAELIDNVVRHGSVTETLRGE
jgi:DNA-binding NarL/FixJ family response regulator